MIRVIWKQFSAGLRRRVERTVVVAVTLLVVGVPLWLHDPFVGKVQAQSQGVVPTFKVPEPAYTVVDDAAGNELLRCDGAVGDLKGCALQGKHTLDEAMTAVSQTMQEQEKVNLEQRNALEQQLQQANETIQWLLTAKRLKTAGWAR